MAVPLSDVRLADLLAEPASRTLSGALLQYNHEEQHLDRFFRSLQYFLDMGLMLQMQRVYEKNLSEMREAVLRVVSLTDHAIVDVREEGPLRDSVYAKLGIVLKKSGDSVRYAFKKSSRVYGTASLLSTETDIAYDLDWVEILDFVYALTLHIDLHSEGAEQPPPPTLHDAPHDVMKRGGDQRRMITKDSIIEMVTQSHILDVGPLHVFEKGVAASLHGFLQYRRMLAQVAVEPFTRYRGYTSEEHIEMLKNSNLFAQMAGTGFIVQPEGQDHEDFEVSDTNILHPNMATKLWPFLMSSRTGMRIMQAWFPRTAAGSSPSKLHSQFRESRTPGVTYLFGGHHAYTVIRTLATLLQTPDLGQKAWILTPRWAVDVSMLISCYRTLTGKTTAADLGASLEYQLDHAHALPLYDARLHVIAKNTSASMTQENRVSNLQRIYYNTSMDIPLDTTDMYNVVWKGAEHTLQKLRRNRIIFPRGAAVHSPLFSERLELAFRDKGTSDDESARGERWYAYDALPLVLYDKAVTPVKIVEDTDPTILETQNLEYADRLWSLIYPDLKIPDKTIRAESHKQLRIQEFTQRARVRELSEKPSVWTRWTTVLTDDPPSLPVLDSERTTTWWLSHLFRPRPRINQDRDDMVSTRRDLMSMFADEDYYSAIQKDTRQRMTDDLQKWIAKTTPAFLVDYMLVALQNDLVQYNPAVLAPLMKGMVTPDEGKAGIAIGKAYIKLEAQNPAAIPLKFVLPFTSDGSTDVKGTWVHTLLALFYDPRAATETRVLLSAPAQYVMQHITQLFSEDRQEVTLKAWQYLHTDLASSPNKRYVEERTHLANALGIKMTTYMEAMLDHYLHVAEYTLLRYMLGVVLPCFTYHIQDDHYMYAPLILSSNVSTKATGLWYVYVPSNPLPGDAWPNVALTTPFWYNHASEQPEKRNATTRLKRRLGIPRHWPMVEVYDMMSTVEDPMADVHKEQTKDGYFFMDLVLICRGYVSWYSRRTRLPHDIGIGPKKEKSVPLSLWSFYRTQLFFDLEKGTPGGETTVYTSRWYL